MEDSQVCWKVSFWEARPCAAVTNLVEYDAVNLMKLFDAFEAYDDNRMRLKFALYLY